MARRSASERAQHYLDRRSSHRSRPLVAGRLDGIEQVVVIPALAEEHNLFLTLADLSTNPEPELARTLVICVINNRADTSRAEIDSNLRTLCRLEQMLQGEADACRGLRLGYIDAAGPGRELPARQGVGAARKLGLDYGLAVLSERKVANGLLLCLDADTRVRADYLAAVESHFRQGPAWAGIIDYQHPIPDQPVAARAIISYEIFLRYCVLGLRYAGSPYAYPSIGSVTVCSANAYATAGGMNHRQAGEDFYFLQQLAKTGVVEPIRTTRAFPSPRVSHRVPFGTGASVGRISGDSAGAYRIYHPHCYQILRRWLAVVSTNAEQSAALLLARAGEIAPQLGGFLQANRFAEVWPRLQANAADQRQLQQQFHRWFDGFKTMKLTHYLREHGYPSLTLAEAVRGLLELARQPLPELPWDEIESSIEYGRDLLDHLRRIDRAQAGPAGVGTVLAGAVAAP